MWQMPVKHIFRYKDGKLCVYHCHLSFSYFAFSWKFSMFSSFCWFSSIQYLICQDVVAASLPPPPTASCFHIITVMGISIIDRRLLVSYDQQYPYHNRRWTQMQIIGHCVQKKSSDQASPTTWAILSFPFIKELFLGDYRGKLESTVSPHNIT